MKQTKLILAGAAALLALASCSSLDDNSTWGKDGQVSFTSYIAGQKTTKASGTSWADGDKIGIFMKQTGSTLDAATDKNKLYITDDRGNLTAATAAEAISYPEMGNADFVAYYPYSASVTGTTLAISVKDQSKPADIDVLYSNNAENISSTATSVNLGFSHKLATIHIDVTADATIASTAGLKVALSGTGTEATLDLTDGTLTVDGNSTANIDFLVNEAGTQAEAIVIPQDGASDAKIAFTLDGKTVETPLPASALKAGTRYILPATLKKEGGQVYVSFGQATITDWTDVPGGGVSIDFADGESGEVDPDPVTPDQGGDGSGEEVVIFEETFGESVEKVNNYWPSIYTTDWTSTSGLTFTDPLVEENGWSYSNCSVRQTTALDPHAWLAASKDSKMMISGFSTSGYSSLTLSYSIATNTANANQNCIAVFLGDTELAVPSSTIATTNTYQTVTLSDLAPGATTLTFYSASAVNTAGMRIDNIKLVGVK
jgi:hypothetical protein